MPARRPLLRPTLGALWLTKVGDAPPALLDYLQYKGLRELEQVLLYQQGDGS